MKKNNKGYTLIELVVAMSLFIIILLGGTSLFTQNLRSEGLTEVTVNMNSTLRSVLDELERVLRYGRVITIDNVDRDQCLAFGTTGFTGSTFVVEDINGLVSTYELDGNKISSVSSQTNEAIFLSPETIKINSFSVQWFCQSGISDKINLEINASSTALGSGVTVTKTVSRNLVLLNGSIN